MVKKASEEKMSFQEIVYRYTVETKDLKKGVKEVSDELKKADKQAEDFTETLGDIDKKGGKSVSDFGKKLGNLAKAAAAAFAVKELGEFVKGLADLQSEASGVQTAFNALNRPGLLANLRRATAGTVSDLELMKAALRAREFNIPQTTLAKGLEFARVQANKLGLSVQQLSSDFVDGVGRKSIQILDNLGISQADLSEKVKETGNFYEAVGLIVDEKLGEEGAAGTIETLADKQARFNAQIENLRLELSERLLPFFEKVVDEANNLVSQFGSLQDFGVGISPEQLADAESRADALADTYRTSIRESIEAGTLSAEEAVNIIETTNEALQRELEETGRTASTVTKDVLDILGFQATGGPLARITENAESVEEQTAFLLKQVEALKILADEFRDYKKVQEDSTETVEKSTEAIEAQAERLRDLAGEYERIEAVDFLDDLADQWAAAEFELNKYLRTLREAQAADEELRSQDVEDPFDTQKFLDDQEAQKDAAQASIDELNAFASANEQAILAGFGGLAEGIAGIFGVTAENSQKFLAFQKLLVIADIILNLQKELGGLAAGAAPFLLNPITGPGVAAALAAAQTSAGIRAGVNIATVAATAIPQFTGQGFAKGTSDTPEGVSLVGEKGPELLWMPKGSKVFNHEASKKYNPVIDALNAGRFEEFVQRHYVIPAMMREQGMSYDDFDLRKDIRSNKEVRLHPSTIRQLGKYFKPERKRWH